jgi:UDP-N-acetylmuramoyl-L-alanyl-D-glutamate--2,6-diaminopimelate ligase
MALTSLASAQAAVHWLRERGVRALASDSRRVTPGDAFVAWPGAANDARRFVREALRCGARACLVEAQGASAFDWAGLEGVASVHDLKRDAGAIASAFLGEPSRQLTMLASTGTNGKTSTAWWTAQALAARGRRCGVIGTLGCGVPPGADGSAATLSNPGLTTPDPIALHATLRSFVERGLQACAIEASSIGVAEQRLNGTHLDVVMFTNLTQDHLDYHGSMQAYWAAKLQLFEWPGLKAAVVNIDDPRGAVLADQLRGGAIALWTYSVSTPARLRARNVRYRDGGLCFAVLEDSACVEVKTSMIGDYNVSNLLSVIGGLRSLDIALVDATRALSHLTPVPGRMQRVVHGDGRDHGLAAGPAVVVDYAHTPDALDKALIALQPLARQRGGRLWCVFGCGGNRDPGKRPVMGAIAVRHADTVVVTSDNPRDEDPAAIIDQIVAGVPPQAAQTIEDRRAAIAYTVANASADDVILLAGKGHEDYQEIRGVKRPFSDVDEARRGLVARGGRT